MSNWLSDFQEANGNAVDAISELRWIVGNLRAVGFGELAGRIADNVNLLDIYVNQMNHAVSQKLQEDYEEATGGFGRALTSILEAIDGDEEI